LARQYNFKEIHNLLKCINESGYKEQSSYDECISSCIRVFAAASNNKEAKTAAAASDNLETTSNQLYNKEIEDLIKLIKNDENRINAYILNGRLRSAYLIAIKIEKVEIVRHIANVAERVGQHLIKDICNKWLEKKSS
jgi:zinc finger FYVE domain-containing protein 26